MEEMISKLVANLQNMMYKDYHIHAGAEREVSQKIWEWDDKKRLYLSIQCFSAAGNFKGSYKCGYVDMVSGEYIVGKYDDVNAETMEYIGR